MNIRTEFEALVKEGVLVPTGEMRRNRNGELGRRSITRSTSEVPSS
jgi:hypothetical protein